MEYFVSVYSHDFALAFCQATEPLCPDIQRLIWKEVLHAPYKREPPPTPEKCRVLYNRFSGTLPRNLGENM
jgi:hypothetical protein